jgi:hypothetical protein
MQWAAQFQCVANLMSETVTRLSTDRDNFVFIPLAIKII